MPTYEYICRKCGHTFEVVQSIKANALTVCPRDVCPRKPWGKGKVERRISLGAGIIFKGSGFYSNDYPSESYKSGAKKEKNALSTPRGDANSDAKTSSSSPAVKPATPTPSTPAKKTDS